MKIIKTKIYAESFDELYDWVDDETVENIDSYEANDFETIDYDALERGEVPVVRIDDAGVEKILVDNLQDEPTEEPSVEEPFIEKPEVEPEAEPEAGSSEKEESKS